MASSDNTVRSGGHSAFKRSKRMPDLPILSPTRVESPVHKNQTRIRKAARPRPVSKDDFPTNPIDVAR
jgi:hypothetical protein